MKIPRKVKFGDHWWKVKFVRNLRIDGEDLDGYCNATDKIILIRSGMSRKMRWRALVHESVHALDYTFNGKFRLREETVTWLEEPMHDWLIKNFIGRSE